MPSWPLLLAASLLCPAIAVGATLRMCTDVNPHLPYLTPDGGGTVGLLVAAAARETGVVLVVHPASLARCRAEVFINLVHGFPMTPYMPELLTFAAYPMRGNAPDAARAVVSARIMLFRRIGAPVAWDGKRLTGLARPVLVAAGSVTVRELFKASATPVDENGKSLEVNLAKMMAGRGELAAGFEEEGVALLRLPRFAGKVEMLPLPLVVKDYYLAVSKDYYFVHRAQVERMWDAIGRLNQAAKAKIK